MTQKHVEFLVIKEVILVALVMHQALHCGYWLILIIVVTSVRLIGELGDFTFKNLIGRLQVWKSHCPWWYLHMIFICSGLMPEIIKHFLLISVVFLHTCNSLQSMDTLCTLSATGKLVFHKHFPHKIICLISDALRVH